MNITNSSTRDILNIGDANDSKKQQPVKKIVAEGMLEIVWTPAIAGTLATAETTKPARTQITRRAAITSATAEPT